MTAPSFPPAGDTPVNTAENTSAVAWGDPARGDAFAKWLARIAPAQRLRPETVRLASADASFRRYFRIDTDGSGTEGAATRIVMDAPPAQEDSAPFVKVAQLMRDAGAHAPQVLEWDTENGFLLLDDLGRQTMLDVIDPNNAEASRPLYDEAIDELVRWQLASKPGVLPPYDRALLERELALFPDWYVTRHRGVAVEGKLQERLERSFKLIVESNLASPTVYVHRDFMPRNLMVPAPGSAQKRLGVLDFQDAVHGPITYDIASLMRDAFLTWEEDFVLDVTVRYWQKARRAGLPVGDDFGEFYRAVEWMGLQRHLKILGIFARLTLKNGKPRYLLDTPRFIAYARATCARYRQLGPLMVLLDEIEGNETRVGYTF